MLKKLISLLLLLFMTQSVLASFDLHHGLAIVDDNASIDIIEHYVDTHGYNHQVVHKCQTVLTDKLQSHSDYNSSSVDENSLHHHECHGHTSTITFSTYLMANVAFTPVYTRFSYLLNEYSITLNSLQRPPIH